MDYESLVPVWNGFFREKTFFSYKRCPGCGLLFAPTFFTSEQLEALYAQMPPNMDVVPIETLRRTQRGYFDVLKRHSKLEGGLIEIGPDVGLFTENCVREGAFDRYWLFEPNRDVSEALHETMGNKQHEIIYEMFGFNRVPDGAASTAVMIHVLDHLLDPVATLTELREKLSEGARLIIVTHDESSLLPKLIGPRWPAYCLQHPELYNPRSMKTLLDAAGYDIVELSKTTNHFPIQFLVRHGLWAVGMKVERVPSFGGLTLGLRLGNMVTVAEPRTK